jgi:hypothetical protein
MREARGRKKGRGERGEGRGERGERRGERGQGRGKREKETQKNEKQTYFKVSLKWTSTCSVDIFSTDWMDFNCTKSFTRVWARDMRSEASACTSLECWAPMHDMRRRRER